MAQSATTGSRSFELEVISPERVLMRARAKSIQVPASDGLLGILAGHAPLVSALVPGVLKIAGEDGHESKLSIGEGFVEVTSEKVRVLVDSAERPGEIDVGRAKEAQKRAQDRLGRRGDRDIDFMRAQAALQRAMARLKATAAL